MFITAHILLEEKLHPVCLAKHILCIKYFNPFYPESDRLLAACSPLNLETAHQDDYKD